MEEDGDGEDMTPFWVQSTTDRRRVDRLRRGVSSLFFSSGLVVFLLLVTAVSFLAFVVPSTISFSAGNIFRPNSVKKSWDSLNIFLVLVAVVFGFLSRNKNEERYTYYDESQASPIKENESQKSNPSTPNKWYNYSTNEEQKPNLSAANQWYDEYQHYHQPKLEYKNPILRRNSSSYPDLREFSSTHWSYGDYERRFYDDIRVDSTRRSDPGQLQLHHRRHRSLEQVDYLRELPQTKTVIVDTLVSKSNEDVDFPPALPLPSPSPSPSPSPPPPPAATREEEILKKGINESAAARKERSSRKLNKDLESLNPNSAPKPPLPPAEDSPAPEFQENQKRKRERVARKRERSSRKQSKDIEQMNPVTAPPPQPPPTTPPPPPPPPPPQQKSSKSDRKKDFLTSLYHKKKKKQRQKSVDNMDSLLHEDQPPLSFEIPPQSTPPQPPPPPPPPPSVFQNLFSSKKQKSKRTITVTLEPHPPPPPPPPPRAEAREPEPTSQPAPLANHKPPQPIKMSSFDKLDEASNSGGESPMNRIPPPPPPPPPSFLKNPAWKFVVQGDYVRINSNTSSRSGSPEPDEADSDVTPSAADGGDAAALFCPSPDVNTKAESFITNFRAKLKLEKIHSMKKRELGLSTLGPGPRPSPSQI